MIKYNDLLFGDSDLLRKYLLTLPLQYRDGFAWIAGYKKEHVSDTHCLGALRVRLINKIVAEYCDKKYRFDGIEFIGSNKKELLQRLCSHIDDARISVVNGKVKLCGRWLNGTGNMETLVSDLKKEVENELDTLSLFS